MLHFAAQRGYILPKGSDMQIYLAAGAKKHQPRKEDCRFALVIQKGRRRSKNHGPYASLKVKQPEMRTGNGTI
jgi:hypothetical protein